MGLMGEYDVGFKGHVGFNGHAGFKGQKGFNGHVGFKGHVGFNGHILIRLIKLCPLRVMNHTLTIPFSTISMLNR